MTDDGQIRNQQTSQVPGGDERRPCTSIESRRSLAKFPEAGFSSPSVNKIAQ